MLYVRYYVHMKREKTISITDARRNIFDIADSVQKPDTHYTLTERGSAKAVIMSAKEFEMWRETLDVEREMPDLERDIKLFEKDLKSGAYKKYSTLDDILAKEGYEKVRNNVLAKSKKGT